MTISHKNKNLNDNKTKILKISKKKKIKMRNIGEETRFGKMKLSSLVCFKVRDFPSYQFREIFFFFLR